MKKMWAAYAAAAAVFYLVGSTLYVAGSFRSIDPVLAGKIETMYPGIYGPEDMDLDDATGRLYISSADRWKTFRGLSPDDGIWVLDVDSSTRPRRLIDNYFGEFHPHGISLLKKDSINYLFAVNHNREGNFVEVFRIAGDSLLHLRSFTDPVLCCPNDVVAVDPDKFYVTNDHGSPKGFKRTLEEYGRLPYSKLYYVDGATLSVAHEGLQYANGVNINADGSRLYMATTIGRDLLTFERNKTNGQLTLINTLSLKTGLDNIDVDADGALWIAAHPKLLAFVGHAKDSTKKSPSQVLRIVPLANNEYRVDEVFMDDGSQLSGSSVAVRYRGQLFVGGVFQPRILRISLSSGGK